MNPDNIELRPYEDDGSLVIQIRIEEGEELFGRELVYEDLEFTEDIALIINSLSQALGEEVRK